MFLTLFAPGHHSSKIQVVDNKISVALNTIRAQLDPSMCLLWSDLRTAYRLLAVGNCPYEPIRVEVRCRAEVEVLDNCSEHLGVRLSKPLGTGLELQLPCNVLTQKTE